MYWTIDEKTRFDVIIDRISQAGNAIASVRLSLCPSVSPSICFHLVSWKPTDRGNKPTDGGDCITSLANAVGNERKNVKITLQAHFPECAAGYLYFARIACRPTFPDAVGKHFTVINILRVQDVDIFATASLRRCKTHLRDQKFNTYRLYFTSCPMQFPTVIQRVPKMWPHLYFLITLSKINLFSIMFGMRNPEEILQKCFEPVHHTWKMSPLYLGKCRIHASDRTCVSSLKKVDGP